MRGSRGGPPTVDVGTGVEIGILGGSISEKWLCLGGEERSSELRL